MFVTYVASEEVKPFRIVGSWGTQAKRLKEKYPQLTDTDLWYESGKEIELLFRMQAKLRMKLEDVITVVKRGMPEKD